MEINEVLKKLRKEKGVTQKEVAEGISISKNAYSNYEQGIREPSIATIKALCRYFEVDPTFLLDYKY